MTTPSAATISEMFGQSVQVITKPSVRTFELYENSGTAAQAAMYVALFAAIGGIFGLAEGLGGFLSNILQSLIGFFVFAGLVYYIGKQQGGTGTFDQVAYTFSLFWGPVWLAVAVLVFVLLITIVGILLVPFVVIAALVLTVYLAYLAVRSSMNLGDQGKALLTLGLAAVGTFVAQAIVNRIV